MFQKVRKNKPRNQDDKLGKTKHVLLGKFTGRDTRQENNFSEKRKLLSTL